jgi:hypothetical protein
MAVSSGQISVGTTPVLLTVADTDSVYGSAIAVRVPSAATAPIFLGPAGVTTTSGFELAVGASATVTLGGGESLYAVAASAQTVHVLRTGV